MEKDAGTQVEPTGASRPLPAVRYAAKSTEDFHGSIPTQLDDAPGEALDLSWAEDKRVFPKDPGWYAQMMVASLRRRIAVGLEKLEEAAAEDDNMAITGISTMIDHLRTQLDGWERDMRRLHRARFQPVRSSTVERVTVPQPRRRLDRRLACGRPRARAVVRASSRGGDSGDDSSGDPEPGPNAGSGQQLLLADSPHGTAGDDLLAAIRRAVEG